MSHVVKLINWCSSSEVVTHCQQTRLFIWLSRETAATSPDHSVFFQNIFMFYHLFQYHLNRNNTYGPISENGNKVTLGGVMRQDTFCNWGRLTMTLTVSRDRGHIIIHKSIEPNDAPVWVHEFSVLDRPKVALIRSIDREANFLFHTHTSAG
ncbi:hypothetical protein J6590_019179 [Homalodisca vitripennis]|nr:hypothetical protein J6590_019179 [Homalodisca vitripennis]